MSPSCQLPPAEGVYALLTDGTTVLIRPANPGDASAVQRMHEQMSPDNIYLRFFSPSKVSAGREARRVTRPPGHDHVALLAWLGDRLIGVASYESTDKPEVAEIAFAVIDDMHGRGVATLLLDHLVSIARLRGIVAFTAETLARNEAMLRVFAAVGLRASRRVSQGVIQTTFPLPGEDASQQLQDYLDTVARRESLADVASLRPLLDPASVAVVGASRDPAKVGHAILRNVISAGFAGRVFAVNPDAASVAGVDAVASAADLPEPPDVAVIAVPAARVVRAARECGQAGTRALVVISAGVEPHTAAELLAVCRRYGMRLVGPNSFGIAVPGLGLNATFAGTKPPPGVAGLVMQSGGIGMAVLEHLSRLGIGVSSFASTGDKYDVSSNDLLTWWEQDELTRLAVLYVESFGSPRRFAKTARRVGRKFPVLTVIGGRSMAGQRAAAFHVTPAASHAPVAGTSLIAQEALFGQAGVIATASLGELIDAAALLASQPLLAGNRIAIVSNAGGAGVLAADACGGNDLVVATLAGPVRHRLRESLPDGAIAQGPVDTTAAVSQAAFRSCLEQVALDDGVDAVMAVTVRTALGDLAPSVAAAVLAKPLVAVMLDQQDSVRLLRQAAGDAGPRGAVPAYLYPESAARALAHAVRYSSWRAAGTGQIPEVAGIDLGSARRLVARVLAGQRLGGWLEPSETTALLASFGIVPGPPGADTGAGDSVPSVRLLIAVRHEPVFGPLVVFGPAGGPGDIAQEQIARLTPLTDTDIGQLIRGTRAAPLLLGQRGPSPVDLDALTDLLLRVSRLADDLPEVAELELSPVLARQDRSGGVYPVSASIRLAPAEPQDPFLRRLR
ncbi:MAG TPA: GNAT family N-acetyltransferase [Streptosporangiaceae bacterium]|nr:GNAT family N-acetyltransferase [Streptosporangiaceae bacterium]